jgi:hypothetical protein
MGKLLYFQILPKCKPYAHGKHFSICDYYINQYKIAIEIAPGDRALGLYLGKEDKP